MNEKNELNTNLDPEVEKIRDQIISKIGDKPLDEVNQIIKKLLMENMDETMRLAALAARVKIIRGKISLLYDNKIEINKPKPKPVEQKSDEKTNIKEEKWVRIKMLESGEVNGKQIDKDVILDVKEEDSKILINAKKAEIVVDKSEKANKPDLTKKADIDPEKKASVKTDNQEEAKESKSDKNTNEAEQNIEDTNKKDLLDKHAKKEKDDKIENKMEDSKDSKSDENKTAEQAAPSSESKPVEEAKGEDKPAEQAAPPSESKPVEEAKGEDKPAEQAAPSSESKPVEEAKGEDKPAEQAAPSSESKPVEEAKGEDKPAEQAAPSSESKPVEENNAKN